MRKIFKNLFVFISYFLYEYLFIELLLRFGIDYNTLSIKHKILTLLSINLIYMFIIYFLYRKELNKDLDDFTENGAGYFNKYLWVYLVGVLLMGFSNVLLQHITNLEISGNEAQVRSLIKEFPLYMTFSSVLYAPFIEEMIFRKTIRNVFDKKYLFIVISGAIFGILHISDYSNFNEVLMGIPYIIMGVDFAYIYYKTNNIFTTMSFHMCHNLILLIVQFL